MHSLPGAWVTGFPWSQAEKRVLERRQPRLAVGILSLPSAWSPLGGPPSALPHTTPGPSSHTLLLTNWRAHACVRV